MTKITEDQQVELIKSLRKEFEHAEEYKGKVESQWLMGVSLASVSSRETSAEYLVLTSSRKPQFLLISFPQKLLDKIRHLS